MYTLSQLMAKHKTFGASRFLYLKLIDYSKDAFYPDVNERYINYTSGQIIALRKMGFLFIETLPADDDKVKWYQVAGLSFYDEDSQQTLFLVGFKIN